MTPVTMQRLAEPAATEQERGAKPLLRRSARRWPRALNAQQMVEAAPREDPQHAFAAPVSRAIRARIGTRRIIALFNLSACRIDACELTARTRDGGFHVRLQAILHRRRMGSAAS